MSSSELRRVTYISRFAESLGEAEIRQIGRLSQRNNARDDVTGVLLASAGTFFQILEGPRDAVDAIYTRILRDPRHRDIVCLGMEDGASARLFPGWSMETVDLDAIDRGVALPVQAMLRSLEEAYRIIDRYTQPRVSELILKGINPLSVPPRRADKLVLCAAIDDASLAIEAMDTEDGVVLLDTFADICGRRIALAGGEIFRLGGAELLACFPPGCADAALGAVAGIRDELAATVDVEPEDSPLRYLKASFGLALGAVVEGNVGSSLKKEFTVVGAAVHTASELCARAADTGDGVLITSEVREALEDGWALESLGVASLRGLTRPTAIYRFDAQARARGVSREESTRSSSTATAPTTTASRTVADRSISVSAVRRDAAVGLERLETRRERLGRYQVIEEIGSGSTGRVYLGRDPVIGRKVALKTLDLRQTVDPGVLADAKRRFLHEAELAGRLNHPNIAVIYDCGEEDETAFIAMELLEGFDLSRHARPERLLPPQTALRAAGQVARALHYAHARGVIHQDIKPANLMVVSRRIVKVTDFGIARAMDRVGLPDDTIRGTPAYMSPEQVRGAAIDHRSDIFSLGVTLYALLTGRRPFAADDFLGYVHSICDAPHPDPREFNADLTADVVALIDRALAKRRDDRFANAAEVVRAIDSSLHSLDDASAERAA